MQYESRRRFLKTTGALALALAHSGLLRAASEFPIADAHSHIGLISSQLPGRSLKAQMQESGVTLLSWNIVADGPWIASTNHGIEQRSIPKAGDQAAYLRRKLDAMRNYLATIELGYVQKPSDIDAARSGSPHVVIAVEGAGYAEDGLELLD